MDFRAYVRRRLPPLALAREPEILDELAQHLSELYHEAIASGLDHDAALANASAALPQQADDLAQAIESASRSLPGVIAGRWAGEPARPEPRTPRPQVHAMFMDLRRDLAYSVRLLARTPGFTLVVVLTMAIGIGANAAIFTAIDAVLLRSAPIADPDRAVVVYVGARQGGSLSGSYPDYVDLRDTAALEGLAALSSISLALDLHGATEAIVGEVVTSNYFDVLGVRLAQGRAFAPDEDRPGAPVRVAVASHAMWLRRLGGDPGFVGRTIALNGRPYTVIGIAPRDFTGPILGRSPEVWVPMAVQPEVRPPTAGLRRSLGTADMLGYRGGGWLTMIGRLRQGSSIEEAGAIFDATARRLQSAHPETNQNRQFSLGRLADAPGLRTAARPLLRVLGWAALLVLMMACANVAGLLLARSVSRRREVAVRMAIGAGRGRLIRQHLTESILLSFAGAAAGIVIAISGAPVLHRFGIPETVPLQMNARVLAFMAAAAVASGVLFGLAPVLQTIGRDTLVALRDEGSAVATGVRAARMRSGLVVLQVALSLMLLVGAGLFLRTLRNAYSVDLGYQINRQLLVDINLDVRGYTQEVGQAAFARIFERLASVPGVQAVGAARVGMLSGAARTVAVSLDGRPVQRGGANARPTRANVVSDGYLDALGTRVLSGRAFSPSDTPSSPRVAIVSRGLAARIWGSAEAVGQTLMIGSNPLEVVGVVPDVVYLSAVERDPPPFFLLPLTQNYESGLTLHIRTAGDPMSVLPSVRSAIREIDPQLVVGRPRPFTADFERSLDGQRMMATLVGFFGAVSLLLAALGLYGVMAHLAAQRTAEIGIRVALGAAPRSILRLLVGSGVRLVTIGTVLGLAGAFAGTRLLRNQLFGVGPTDPATFAVVAVVLLAVAAAACAIPARRAMRVDPVAALRTVGR